LSYFGSSCKFLIQKKKDKIGGEAAKTGGYENLMKFINTYPETMISNRNQTCVYLPRTHVKASQFKEHISYFLQNCKKANRSQRVCLYDIRKHRVLEIMLSFDQLQ